MKQALQPFAIRTASLEEGSPPYRNFLIVAPEPAGAAAVVPPDDRLTALAHHLNHDG